MLTRRIVRTDAENYLGCNVGRAVLGSFAAHVLNFRDMAFVLR